jgi:hypothetical protein
MDKEKEYTTLGEYKLYERAVEKWGVNEQLWMVEEELSELQLAVCHLRRGKATLADVMGEIADAGIMIGQLGVILKINTHELSAIRNKKLRRLEERLDKI